MFGAGCVTCRTYIQNEDKFNEHSPKRENSSSRGAAKKELNKHKTE